MTDRELDALVAENIFEMVVFHTPREALSEQYCTWQGYSARQL